jgi:hypothetical protein
MVGCVTDGAEPALRVGSLRSGTRRLSAPFSDDCEDAASAATFVATCSTLVLPFIRAERLHAA